MRTVFTILILFCLPCCAMDRFAALSMLESGDNDFVRGPSGERGRYQETERAYREYLPKRDWNNFNALTNADFALCCCEGVMGIRIINFSDKHKTSPSPTDFQWYLLWNCPADVDHPSKTESERAQRFANLCQRCPPKSK